jgi:hypothetical protein
MAGRPVLFSCETLPRGQVQRTLDLLKAYFADSLSEVLNFCEAYGVDYFVVDPRSFDIKGPIFFEPFNSLVYEDIVGQAGYVLQDPPKGMRLYEGDNVIVLQCNSDNLAELSRQTKRIDGLSIIAHDRVPEALSQAESKVELTVKWLAQEELSQDYDICFALNDDSGPHEYEFCQPLSPDLPPTEWQIPEIRYETYSFDLGPYVKSGDYSIMASITSGEPTAAGEGILLGAVTYVALPRTMADAETNAALGSEITWGDAIALADYELDETAVNTLELNVLWHILSRLEDSYKVFAHLREAGSGEIVSQVDTIPRGWTYPTDWWEAGEIISDTLLVPLPDLEPGDYELWLGFYDEASGRRLPFSGVTDLNLVTLDGAVKIMEIQR